MPKKFVTPPSFPTRLARNKKEEEEKEILKTFHKFEVNIPFFDVIKQVPQYTGFLKIILHNKKKLMEYEKVNMRGKCFYSYSKEITP